MDRGVLFWNLTDRGIAGKETVDGDGKVRVTCNYSRLVKR